MAGFEERVRVRAYLIWLGDGKPDGYALEHWNLAREELEAEDTALPHGQRAELPNPFQLERVAEPTRWQRKESAMANEELDQRIRTRAFEIWLEEGRPDGRDLAHWELAEKEMSDVPEQARGQEMKPQELIGEVQSAIARSVEPEKR